jgi:hypothetical protein
MESEMLVGLNAAEQTALRDALVRLAARPAQEETD